MPDIVFADSETRSAIDLTKVGGYRYANHPTTDCLIWSFAFDDGPQQVWSPSWAWHNLQTGKRDPKPTELIDHVANGGYFVAWNAFFDRWIWNAVMVPKYNWPYLELDQVLCAQAQAEANNLPGSLDKAAECLGVHHRKDPQGKRLINILSAGTRGDWDATQNITADRMGRFRAYAAGDVLAMRDVFQYTRPLTLDEWHDYHVSERINDRGVAVDAEFAGAAMQYAAAEFADINVQLAEVTGIDRMTITAHLMKSRWIHDQLWPDEEMQAVTTKPPKKKDGPPRFTCDRSTRETLLEMIALPERAERFDDRHREQIVDFLELIEAGNSAAVRKFTAIHNMETGGRIHGQYSFNGAGQTGRYSSRGVQIHNIIRDPVDKKNPDLALDAMDEILDGATPDSLVDRFGFPVSRLLARLIRPTFIAPDDIQLVWADWDQIEGRCLPWLAQSPGGEAKLDLYREGVDTYRVAAMPIFNLHDIAQVDDDQRQVGKVAELALGFGGAVGAFTAIGKGYGVTVEPTKARQIVDTWRANNPWVRAFWDELWKAAINAYKNPGQWYRAGRVHYLFHSTLMHGTLICRLPDGRWLVYPQFRHEWITYQDENGKEWRKLSTTFVRGFGSGSARIDLWYGILAENVTQATAASFLRLALSRLDAGNTVDVVLHTHDEIVAETPTERVTEARAALRNAMTQNLPEWSNGLPLSVGIESGPYYTK